MERSGIKKCQSIVNTNTESITFTKQQKGFVFFGQFWFWYLLHCPLVPKTQR